MSDIDHDNRQCDATPRAELERQMMDWSIPKTEREWWAVREIERLRAALKTIADAETWSVGYVPMNLSQIARAALTSSPKPHTSTGSQSDPDSR